MRDAVAVEVADLLAPDGEAVLAAAAVACLTPGQAVTSSVMISLAVRVSVVVMPCMMLRGRSQPTRGNWS